MTTFFPDGALRLKQGFGRLIRTRQDRGVVIVCDSRMVTKRYGRAFRSSLPVETRTFADGESLLRSIREFLAVSQKALPRQPAGG